MWFAPSTGVWSILLLLAFDHARSRRVINTFAGPYIVFVHQFDTCPSDGSQTLSLRASHFNPSRPYDLQTLTGNLTLKEDFVDNLWAKVDMAVRANNQWKENAFVMKFPNAGCRVTREHAPDIFRIVAKLSGASTDRNEPCVVPAGTYIFRNESVSWVFPQFKVMPYGRYRLQLKTGKQGYPTTRFCSKVDLEVIPQP